MDKDTMEEMLEVQGSNGNWDCDPYMHGLYNGMEFMRSLAYGDSPVFRDAPESWLDPSERFARRFYLIHKNIIGIIRTIKHKLGIKDTCIGDINENA